MKVPHILTMNYRFEWVTVSDELGKLILSEIQMIILNDNLYNNFIRYHFNLKNKIFKIS